MRFKILLPAFSLLLIFHMALPAPSFSYFIVTLANGQKIQADEYQIKSGRVYLKYKTGEAAILRSAVVSIMDEKGNTNFLSEEGKQKPAEIPVTVPSARNERTGRLGGPSAKEFKPPLGPNARTSLMNIPRSSKDAKPSLSVDDPGFYDGLSPDEADFLKGSKDIMELDNNKENKMTDGTGNRR